MYKGIKGLVFFYTDKIQPQLSRNSQSSEVTQMKKQFQQSVPCDVTEIRKGSRVTSITSVSCLRDYWIAVLVVVTKLENIQGKKT